MAKSIPQLINYANPFCYILVGPVGSGKSKARDEISLHPAMKDCVVISTDDFVKEQCLFTGDPYDVAFAKMTRDQFTRYVARSVRNAVHARKSILVDRCNLTRKSRNQILKHVPPDYNTVAVVMEWDQEDILHRLHFDPDLMERNIPIHNVLNMFKVYQEPSDDECDIVLYRKQFA